MKTLAYNTSYHALDREQKQIDAFKQLEVFDSYSGSVIQNPERRSKRGEEPDEDDETCENQIIFKTTGITESVMTLMSGSTIPKSGRDRHRSRKLAT